MTADAPALWISEADVTSLLDMGTAMTALEQGLQLEARGEATNMTKTHVAWGGGNLHAIGANFTGSLPGEPVAGSIAGTKTWTYTPKGSMPLLILFDGTRGALLAVIEAFALGQLRTAAASGIATRRLARPEARTLAIVGTGEQALPQVAAVAAVRPIECVRVFGRNPDRKTAFMRRVEGELDVAATDAASVADAVGGAEIVTLVTRATEPFLRSTMVTRGAHVNAVGAITPERSEFEPEILDRCDPIVADSVDQTKRLSREFMTYFEQGRKPWSAVLPLSTLVAASVPRGPDLTLFKAMGMGISDLSLGIGCYRLAVQGGLGRKIPRPERARIRLKPAKPIPGGARP